jgi:uncharacterized protein (DUF2062 family)
MRGGFLHSKLGDRVLDKAMWRASPKSLARAWLVGWPITVVPLLPFQTVIAGVACFFVRGNMLFCIALQFLSNPFTAPVHLPACYFVGELVRGRPFHTTWERVESAPLQHLATGDAAISLYLGAFVIGAILGPIGYAVILNYWRGLKPSQPKPVRSAPQPDTDVEI